MASTNTGKLVVDFGKTAGPVKQLHGVNNAPMRLDALGGRQDEFEAAGIPLVRTHDTCGMWGGTHFVDIPNVFPDFDADETDPANYDFAFTDEYLKPLVNANCEIYYRLGVTIENSYRIKAYNIVPPRDPAKWARICEGVVRHYNEGWADGFRWNIRHWEIWNEPENPPMWQGTREQYYELYRVAAKHLKSRFPGIKVGGYGGCGFYSVDDPSRRIDPLYSTFEPWFEDFLAYVKAPETKAPLDFFSWHLYIYENTDVGRILVHADHVRRTLDAAGFADTESHLNEWNVFSGGDPETHRFDRIKESPAAARVMAAFLLMQRSRSVDAAMYYDACPTRAHCGLFYFPSLRTTPTYEAFRAFHVLHALGGSVESSSQEEGVHVAAAKNAVNRAFIVANISGTAVDIVPAVAGADGDLFTVWRLDGSHRRLEADGEWTAGNRLTVPDDAFVLVSTIAPDQCRVESVPELSANGIDG